MQQTLSRSRPGPLRTLSLLTIAALLSACSSSDSGSSSTTLPPEDDAQARTLAFVSGATPVTFDAGQIERFSVGDEIVSTGFSNATGSDIRVATDGTDVYEIGRFNIDSLTRYTADDLQTPVWQYSVTGGETAPNPYEIVFVSDTKAYVVRYNSPLVWIVDPSAATEAEFRIGEIDLSAYDDDDSPNASNAVIVGERLYVLMQRLDGFAPSRDGYVAVIDTTTDTEVDTGMGNDGLLGIALESSNPEGMFYAESTDELYVVGRGNIFNNDTIDADPYDGGIEVIDPVSFQRDTLVDDGTAEENTGFVADALVLSPEQGYILYNTAFGSSTLRSFNPMTGLVADEPVAGLVDADISVLAQAPDGNVWIGLNTSNPDDAMDLQGFTIIDPSDNSVAVERVITEFNPNGIVFIEQSVADSAR